MVSKRIISNMLTEKFDIFGNRECSWTLDTRKKLVKLDGKNGAYGFTQDGVPQGTILKPLLFVLYVNNLLLVFREKCNIKYCHMKMILFTQPEQHNRILETSQTHKLVSK